MANCGATIVFNDIKQELVDKGLAAYKEAGITAHGYVCDVTNEDAVNAMVKQITEEVGSLPEIFEQDPRCYIMTIDDLEMLLATYKKDKSRFDDVVKALVENKRGGNDYKSVLEILNIYQAVGDMHFIGERDYFNKIAEKLKKELGTDQ